MILKLTLVALVALINFTEINGHGMMMNPVSRSSAWRIGFDVPPNYTDNQNYCGGLSVQWNQNGGKCGECGDNYASPRPRPNENGGIFGTGTIVQTYKAGQIMDITVRITANHMGTFKFDICPLKEPKELETEECFSKYPLPLADGSGYTYTLPSQETKEYVVPVVLPEGLTCQQCVVRWTYRAANNWGICEDGRGAVGCGNQEHFRNCADVSIV